MPTTDFSKEDTKPLFFKWKHKWICIYNDRAGFGASPFSAYKDLASGKVRVFAAMKSACETM